MTDEQYPAASKSRPHSSAQVSAAQPLWANRQTLEQGEQLPQFRVLLHSDEKCDALYIVETICDLTPLMPQRAAAVTLEALRTGVGLMLVTHQERAELYVEQFQSREVKVTMEPAR